ncbi:MAG TPA: hypothetical protein VIV40_42420 [Kofleriaceae bacterium]
MIRRIAACLLALGGVVHASGFTDGDQDLRATTSANPDDDSPWPTLQIDGGIRFRAGYLYNFDLDRGLTTSGDPLFPISTSDPSAQATAVRDMRLRTDVIARSRGGTMDVKLRLDILDNTSLGGQSFVDASGRASDSGAMIHLRRAYTEILTPLGVIVAGRMGNQFGLGMVANAGDCFDCDGGDAADRIGLVVPARGMLAAVAFDVSSTALLVRDRPESGLALDPRSNAHAVIAAIMRYHSDAVREIRRRGGRTTIDYGAGVTYLWQDKDTPAEYLLDDPGPSPATMERGLRAFGTSAWFRLERPEARIESELEVIAGSLDQASLIPGALFRDPIKMMQTGLTLESELGAADARFGGGLDAGYASGDPAPGFGAYPALDNAMPAPGDLDGSQARPPIDNRIDNFRFSPNYRVDRILFHQIIGTVTDAMYVRPHARARIVDIGPGTLAASLAAIASWAVEPTSTPSGKRALGVELDSTLTYRTPDGFLATLAHGVFVPGAAFDNPTMNVSARTAQSIELLAGYLF